MEYFGQGETRWPSILIDFFEEEFLNRKKDGAKGFVYFVQGEDTQLIKVGFSTNPTRRLRDLQSLHHEKLRLLAYTPGDFPDERTMHKRFEVHRVRGEWFKPSPQLLEVIKDIQREQR